MKWPAGYRCSKCGNPAYYVIVTRNHPLYECRKCGNQSSLTVGTIFEKTHTDITVWFAAIYMVDQDHRISTAEIANQLEISYQTAWAMARKIRMSLANPRCIESAPRLGLD